MKNEKTSKKVQRIAAKGIRKPESLTPEEVKAVCASALTQSADRVRQETELSAVMQYFEFCELNQVGTEEAFEGLNEIEQSTVLQICRRTLKAAGEKL